MNNTLTSEDSPLGPVPSEAALLMEYDKAQDSAQHHDNLVWNVTSLSWGGSAVLMGFVIDKMTDANPPVLVLLAVVLLGSLLPLFIAQMHQTFRSVRNAKYKRCQDIELQLGMKQHCELKYQAGTQTKYYVYMLWLFMLVWVAVAVKLFSMLPLKANRPPIGANLDRLLSDQRERVRGLVVVAGLGSETDQQAPCSSTRVLTPADFAQIANVRVLPPPASYYANGGVLSSGAAAPTGGYASAADLNALKAEQARTNALLEQMLGHTATTAATNQAIAEKPTAAFRIGEHEVGLFEEVQQAKNDTQKVVSLG